MNDEVKVGNINKPKRPVPGAVTNEGASDGITELNAKLDKLLELAQAIDWKMWVYLKANNYID